MFLGLVIGLLARASLERFPALAAPSTWIALEVFDPLGQIFLRLLFFVVVPLVFASLALGILQLGRLDRLGPLAGRTFLLFGVNMAVGVAIGLAMMNAVNPGGRLQPDARAKLMEKFRDQAQEQRAKAEQQPKLSFRLLVEMFMPKNLVGAVAEFKILPLILFAILIGAAGTELSDDHRAWLRSALEMATQLMTRIVHYALLLAPYAVTAMMCSLIITVGLDVLKALALFVPCVLACMAVHLFGTMSILLKLFTRRSPAAFFWAIRTILVTAFSTSSSNATLPTSIQVSREQLGVSESTAGFVLPLGATMNMSGTALYEGCVVLFVAQAFGIELSFASQITLLLLAVLSAVAVAGIPGASLPLIVGLLASFGVPPGGIGLILGVDRLLDMARTVLNVAADVVTACIVDEAVRERR
jgi:Na+/H+-dicarboxylate symporter